MVINNILFKNKYIKHSSAVLIILCKIYLTNKIDLLNINFIILQFILIVIANSLVEKLYIL